MMLSHSTYISPSKQLTAAISISALPTETSIDGWKILNKSETWKETARGPLGSSFSDDEFLDQFNERAKEMLTRTARKDACICLIFN
jgi:hypothetical protein